MRRPAGGSAVAYLPPAIGRPADRESPSVMASRIISGGHDRARCDPKQAVREVQELAPSQFGHIAAIASGVRPTGRALLER